MESVWTGRYGVGFSGDSPQSYDTLQVQVEVTPQASRQRFASSLRLHTHFAVSMNPSCSTRFSFQTQPLVSLKKITSNGCRNVLFGYWSHDIGGFHNGTVIKGFTPGHPYAGDEDPTNATQSETASAFM